MTPRSSRRYTACTVASVRHTGETAMRSDDDEPDYDIPKEDRNRQRPPRH